MTGDASEACAQESDVAREAQAERPSGEDAVCVVGLGYVGLALALAFDRAGYPTVGYDVDEAKVRTFRQNRDPSDEFGDDAIAASGIAFTDSPDAIADCGYVHVCLPTPLTPSRQPDLSTVEQASETVGRHLSPGSVVVYESTLYPGATREVLEPAVERGMQAAERGATADGGRATEPGVGTDSEQDADGRQFGVGYSPERIAPGTAGRSLTETTKIVSARDEATLDVLAARYDDVIDAEVYRTPSIEVAEAAKCLENVQRDVNIALVNEFTRGCRHLDFDLDPYEVLAAAGTKWNFHEYEPGLVGGHCIPVDPHYLRSRFEESGFRLRLVRAARRVNREMVEHVGSVVVDALRATGREVPTGDGTSTGGQASTDDRDGGEPGGDRPALADARLLLLGLTYKPDVADTRNAAALAVSTNLRRHGIEVAAYDPLVDPDAVSDDLDAPVQSTLDVTDFDGLVALTGHAVFQHLDLERQAEKAAANPVLVDAANAFEPDDVDDTGFTYRRL